MSNYAVQIKGEFYRMEAEADGAIKPGHLLEITSAGKLKAHATAGGVVCPAIFAVEEGLVGNDIADSYTSGERVQANVECKGSQVLARIANGESIAIGDKLVSNGNGELKEATADSSAVIVEQYVIAIAMAACDMSDSSSADPSGLCKVMVL